MPLTPSSVKRAVDTTGDDIKTFDDGAGEKIQAAALVDENAQQAGIGSNPLFVSATTLPLPSGAATSANQTTTNNTLAAILAAVAQQSFGSNQWDEASSTLTYVGLSTADGIWYIKKVDSSAKTIGHATANNNPSYITFTAAWAARTSLTYGRFDEAF